MRANRGWQLTLLTVAVAAAMYARTALGPLQESIRMALELSDNQMAVLQGPALAFPLVMLAFPLGLAIDRYSRARLILGFAIVNLGASLLTALSWSFGTLLAARAVIGLTGTATWITAVSLLADLYDAEHRGRAAMLVLVGTVGGMSAAFGLGGELLAAAADERNGWRWAMLWLSVPQALAIAPVLAMREPTRSGARLQRPAVSASLRELLEFRWVIGPLLAGLAMASVADGAAMIWAAPTLSRRFALSSDRVGGLVATVLLVAGIVGPIVGGVLADYCQRTGGPSRTVGTLGALAMVSIPASAFAVAPSATSVGASLFVFLTIGDALNVTVPALTTVLLPNELRGTCMALISASCLLAAFGLAPVMVSMLSTPLGGTGAIGKALALVCGPTSVLCSAAFLLGRRYVVRSGQCRNIYP